MPRISLRARLGAVVALTFVIGFSMGIVDTITAAGVEEQLHRVQNQYVPRLRYGPQLQRAFDETLRGMQDAVSAEDREALVATQSSVNAVLELLDSAPPALDAPRVAELRSLFEGWARMAFEISDRLLHGETGESLIADIEAMQRAQRAAWAALVDIAYLDEDELATAFEAARRAEHVASQTRMIFRVVLFLSIATTIALALRRVSRAFEALRRGFARIGGGDFSLPIAINGRDELAELGQAANQMAEHIDSLQSGLTAERRELKRVNSELESFSYSVSHDLRAPLRALDGFSQALLEDYADHLDDTAKDYLHRIADAAGRMDRLIDALLTLSRLGRRPLSVTAVNVTDLAREILERLAQADPSRSVTWRVDDGMSATADAELLRVVLQNLTANAWKFTKHTANATIEVGRAESDGAHAFFVRDNGAGFDMNYVGKLFGAFQRLHSDHQFEGTGIGLATVRRVVRRHGGRVWAEGRAGEGATFFFSLERTEKDR